MDILGFGIVERIDISLLYPLNPPFGGLGEC